MRHRKSFNHLSRTAPHRKAMLANLASSLIKHKRITTTTAKAKALRTYIEPLITRSKEDTTHSRRVVFRHLQDKDAVSELFRDISAKVADRPGGYTRILKIGNRFGDAAEMAIIELVDYNENLLEEAAQKTKTRRRRRGGGGAKKETEKTAETGTSTAVEDAEIVDEEKKEGTPAEPTGSAEDVKATPEAETTEDSTAEAEAETTEEVQETEETKEEEKKAPAAESRDEKTKTEEGGESSDEKKDEGENKENEENK